MTNLHPILHRFRVIAEFLVKLSPLIGGTPV